LFGVGNMRNDGEFVTSYWLRSVSTKQRVNFRVDFAS
jgi:hypothetical protein